MLVHALQHLPMHLEPNARAAFYVKWTIHLKSTAIHHLLCMVLWVFSFIPEWRVTPILHQKGDLIWCTLFKDTNINLICLN